MRRVRRLLPPAVALALATVAAFPTPIRQPGLPAQLGCPPDLVAPFQEAGSLTCRPSAGGFIVAVRATSPRLGKRCEDVHYERAEFVESGREVSARFAVFGGLSQGALTLTADQARLIGAWDAYVAEVQLGSYEPESDGPTLECRLNPTFHFDCPTVRVLDELCLVWVAKSSPGQGRTGANGEKRIN